MSQILFLKYSQPSLGLSIRATTYGEEYSLVEQFIDYYCDAFVRYNKKMNLAVFIEPRIETGFPDIVFAHYYSSITDNWSSEREALSTRDLKLLSHLYSAGSASGKQLVFKLGFSEKQTLQSLEKLMDAKLVTYHKQTWHVRVMREVFSLKKLVAVEAKMSAVSKVIEQSHLNTWFASQSYALTSSKKPHQHTVDSLLKCGIGLYCTGSQFKKVINAKTLPLPSSYLSFQFNEWIGKAIAHQEGAVKC